MVRRLEQLLYETTRNVQPSMYVAHCEASNKLDDFRVRAIK